MNLLQKMMCKLLDDTSQNIKNGSCEVTQEDWEQASKLLGHKPLSKEEACNYLHISRSTFDTKIRNGELPRGMKRLGWKELVWYQDLLEEYLIKS